MSVRLELEHAIGLSSIANVLKIHPDGQHLIYPACGTVIISDMLDPTDQAFMRGHNDHITCLDVSRSGKFIVTGQAGYDSDVILWDYDKKTMLSQLSEHDNGVNAVSFAPDERFFVSVGCVHDRKLIVWETATGSIVAITGVNYDVKVASFLGRTVDLKGRPQSTYRIVTCGSEGQLDEWILNPADGTIAQRPMGTRSVQRSFLSIQASPDGQHIFAATYSGDVLIFSVTTGKLVQTVPVSDGEANTIIVEPIGHAANEPSDATERFYYRTYAAEGQATTTLSVAGGDGLVYTYEGHPGATWVKVDAVAVDAGVTSLCRDPTGGCVGCTKRGTIFRIDVDGVVDTVAENHTGPIVGSAFLDQTEELFVAVSEDKTARVWDLADYGVALTVRLPYVPTCVAIADICILVGFENGCVGCYDAETAEELWTVADADPQGVTSIAANARDAVFVTGGRTGDVRLWTFRRALKFSAKEHRGSVTDVVLLNDGQHALTSGQDHSLILWDLARGCRVKQLLLKSGSVNGIALGQDQRYAVSIGSDRRIHYWDLAKETPILVNGAHDAEITAVARVKDLVVTGDSDATVHLWEWDERDPPTEPLQAVRIHSAAVTSIIGQGDVVVTGGADDNLMVWRIVE
ncbi:WD domain, G-beta repeat [Carpediemonas membranifera]|uniref:WD domain, G-beta repeat n=1 Tax=Carpediemonas membranifera TaxID=201153 RepID=A0A8J6BBJ6_9EUKA|nr:WD domain, G-beta repeat [Carpediemonas membranifera]|eukprot:KAG9393942.1 WD domain, G-beta repeat [Carpediemonas membranifera]